MNLNAKNNIAAPQMPRTIFWLRPPSNLAPLKLASESASSHTKSHNQWTAAKSAKATTPQYAAWVASAKPTVTHQSRK